MTVERGSTDGADVQMMGWCAGRGGEGLAAGYPEVAFVAVAEWPQPPDDGGEIGAGGDDNRVGQDGLQQAGEHDVGRWLMLPAP